MRDPNLTDTSPDHERPTLADVTDKGELPGWQFVLMDEDGAALCGWTDSEEFITWATAEQIAAAVRQMLEEGDLS